MGLNFSSRNEITEIMDDLQCSGEVVHQTLRELEVINRWLGGNKVTVKGVEQLLSTIDQNKVITIADVGCGGGDVLHQIANWGRRKKIPLKLTGIDANPHIILFAKENSRTFPEINFLVENVLTDKFRDTKYDLVVATLFTHHFSDVDLVKLLKQFRMQSKLGVVINDIHRHWFAYHSIRLLTRWFSKSAMVKFDAPVSVLRSFTRPELESILHRAEIKDFKLTWKWAFRWQLIIPSSLA